MRVCAVGGRIQPDSERAGTPKGKLGAIFRRRRKGCWADTTTGTPYWCRGRGWGLLCPKRALCGLQHPGSFSLTDAFISVDLVSESLTHTHSLQVSLHFLKVLSRKQGLPQLSPCVPYFSYHLKVKVSQLCPTLCDPMNYIQSMEFSRPEYWSG